MGWRKPKVCPLHGTPMGTDGAFWGPMGPDRSSKGIIEDLGSRKSIGVIREELGRPQHPGKPWLSGPNSTGFSVIFSLFSSLTEALQLCPIEAALHEVSLCFKDLPSTLHPKDLPSTLCPKDLPSTLRPKDLPFNLCPKHLPSRQPGVLPHQQLLLMLPIPVTQVLPASLQDAATDGPLCPGTLRNHFVTPTPITQPPTHQNPKVIKSLFCTESDIRIESWFTVTRSWN